VPDAHISYLANTHWITMGMLLSVPMLLIGLTLLFMAYRRNQSSGNIVGVPAMRVGS
jgi:phosphatidylglycerol:prolipoprotein diacylglycerol transferase